MKEASYLGLAAIILSIFIFIGTKQFFPGLIPLIIGLALIVFAKEEDKIEQRKDIKVKKPKN